MKRNRQILRKASGILGTSVYQHELVRDNPSLQHRLRQCTNLRGVVKLLGEAYRARHGQDLSLPGNRELYIKYMYENANLPSNDCCPGT